MRLQPSFIVTKRNSDGEVYLAPTGFRQSIWRKDQKEATVFHSKITAEKAAKTHGGEMKKIA